MHNFIYILIWFSAIVSTLVMIVGVIGFFTYNELEQMIDRLQGIKRSFHILFPFIIAFISWTAIFCRPF